MKRMLMATMTMAARIERAECDTAVDVASLVGARGTDVMVHRIGGGAAVFAGPGQPFNKTAGLGFSALDEEALAAVERAFDARAAEIRVELATLADPAVAVLLTRRGYSLIGYENVLGLALDGGLVEALTRACDGDRDRGMAIARAAADEARLWIETVTDGFGHPDRFDGPPPTESFDREALIDVFQSSTGAPGMARYLARRDGVVAGGGAIRVSDGLVQLAGASTLPSHRRRGVQSALLRARLLDAARQGCDLAVVTTEPASKSQQNVQRAGFSLLYSRAILVRAPRAPRGSDLRNTVT